jgi:DNA-directed RNA polymerase subunit RPC12/RpoP
MPTISDYKCDKCGFSLTSGWGGYMYVMDQTGKRIVCPHPVEID